jgi:UDP:flavonoid glycosyltransferase YjiC (YdhE family)
MRVLFSVSAWPGHYFPMVPLARRLADAGHHVRFLCAPSQVDAITAAGFAPVPVLDGLDMVLQARLSHYWQAQAGTWPYPWAPIHPETGEHLERLEDFDFPAYRAAHREETLNATRRSYDAAVDWATQWRPNLVVHDRLSLEGLLVARVLGIPAVTHLWGPVGTAEEGTLRLVPGDPTKSFARHGVDEMGETPFAYVIDPCPDALRPPIGPATRLETRYQPYGGPLPGAVGPRDGRPRVVVVWGTSLSAMVGPRSFVVPDVLAALSSLDLDVVALLSPADADRLTAPDGVRVCRDVPLADALADADVVVHHGGAGCVMTSIAAGVPQVAITFAAEQTANADRIAAAGAGRHVPGSTVALASVVDAEAVRAAVSAVVGDPSYRAAAMRLRERHDARPGLDELVAELEELASVPV